MLPEQQDSGAHPPAPPAAPQPQSEKLTVLFVSAMDGLGGPVKRLMTLLVHMTAVRRVLIKPRSDLLDARLRALGCVDEHISMEKSARRNSWGALALALRIFLRAASRRRPVHVIHANGIVEFALSWPTALILGKPVVTWVGNYESPAFVKRFSWIFRPVASRARWNAVSSTAADVIADCGLVPRELVRVVTNIVDPADVTPAGEAGYSSDSGRVKIGYLQVARWEKGFDLVPKIIEQLRDLQDQVEFLIYATRSDAPGWSELDDLPQEMVKLRPRTATVGEIYAECDIVFSPSRRESFNRVVAEAMTSGTAVVASDLEPVRAIVGEAGLLFPVDDVQVAAGCLRRLVKDPQLRADLGELGHTRSRAWLPAPVAAEFESQYRSLVRF
jgi:glycosyltransferase involved in cell wall biosynthesis